MIEKGFTVDILDHGYLTYLDSLGTDQYLADTARVSTGSQGKSLNLVSRLVADRHTSPLEFGIIQFEIKAPLFVFREWHRHRTQSYSEMSARFGELSMDFYLPSLERMNPQHATNKQMSDETQIIETPASARRWWKNFIILIKKEINTYRDIYPLTRELAQRLYPQNRYTICRASGNLWNWMAFLKLRMAPDAQYEIRQYADEIEKILKKLFPVAMEAWEEFIFYAVTISQSDRVFLKDIFRIFEKQEGYSFLTTDEIKRYQIIREKVVI
jgi:thymidylate synthase (FAD)